MSSVSLLCAPRKRNPFHTAWLIVSILMVNTSSCVSARAFGAQNDVWKQIVPQGHRLFRKHGYGPDMMRCQSLGSLDGCSRALAHLQRSSQVVQLSEQLECILSRRLSEGDSLSARSVVDALFGAHYATATRLAWPNFDREWMKIFVRGTRQNVLQFCVCATSGGIPILAICLVRTLGSVRQQANCPYKQ